MYRLQRSDDADDRAMSDATTPRRSRRSGSRLGRMGLPEL
jgi:hypothetical protein